MIKINVKSLEYILKVTPAEQNVMLVGRHGIGKSKILENYYTKQGIKTEKFKNTKYEWKICESSSSDDSFMIELAENNNLVSMIVVDKSDFLQKITEWKL